MVIFFTCNAVFLQFVEKGRSEELNGSANSDFSKEFAGEVDGKYPVRMFLEKKGTDISGVYFYEKYGKKIFLSGHIDNNNEFTINEFVSEKQTGIFKGKFQENDKLTGTWMSPDKKRVMPFMLKETFCYDTDSETLKGKIDDLLRKRILKHNVFVKIPNETKWMEIVASDNVWVSERDRSTSYYVYRNEFEKVLCAKEFLYRDTEGFEVDNVYYFNEDKTLFALETRVLIIVNLENGEKDILVKYITSYYDGNLNETAIENLFYKNGKKADFPNDPFPSVRRQLFQSFNALKNEKFPNSKKFNLEKEWICHAVIQGYGDLDIILRKSRPLKYFEKDIFPLNLKDIDNIDLSLYKVEIKLVGKIKRKRIYDILCTTKDDQSRAPKLKTIILEKEKGRYAPILCLLLHDELNSSYIVNIAGKNILTHRSRMSGTGYFHYEYYFNLDSGLPKSLHFGKDVGGALNDILPPGFAIYGKVAGLT